MVTILKDLSGETNGVSMTVYGEPVAQGRPRFSSQGKFIRAYDPKKSSDYKKLLRDMAQEVYEKDKEFMPFDKAICLLVFVYRSIPKSFSNKKREEALKNNIRPTTKPDASNYLKGIEDGLNGILWKDDSCIVCETIYKLYSDQPRIELTVWSL